MVAEVVGAAGFAARGGAGLGLGAGGGAVVACSSSLACVACANGTGTLQAGPTATVFAGRLSVTCIGASPPAPGCCAIELESARKNEVHVIDSDASCMCTGYSIDLQVVIPIRAWMTFWSRRN